MKRPIATISVTGFALWIGSIALGHALDDAAAAGGIDGLWWLAGLAFVTLGGYGVFRLIDRI